MTESFIDPALNLDLVPKRTLRRRIASVSVIIPAHNEEATVGEVVGEAHRGLKMLGVGGEVVVSASGCSDNTADVAQRAGARVVEAPIGKGAAITAALKATAGDIVCLIDGDVRYFGEEPLSALVLDPILSGVADACITDLYWRPIYPQMWLHGFFAPLAGTFFPELLPRAGSTPWSGQRAARRELWPAALPSDFTVDLALLLHWNFHAACFRPVLADDWTNPMRPKPDLMRKELALLLRHAVERGRMDVASQTAVERWFDAVHDVMASYRHGEDEVRVFERQLLETSLRELQRQLQQSSGVTACPRPQTGLF